VPNITHKNVLVFDIDDTLLADYQDEFFGPSTVLRPFCREVLAALSKYYDIWLWTAGTKEHA